MITATPTSKLKDQAVLSEQAAFRTKTLPETNQLLQKAKDESEIWGSSWDNDIASLRVYMASLRKKIEPDADSPQYIQTHTGVGYRMLKAE